MCQTPFCAPPFVPNRPLVVFVSRKFDALHRAIVVHNQVAVQLFRDCFQDSFCHTGTRAQGRETPWPGHRLASRPCQGFQPSSFPTTCKLESAWTGPWLCQERGRYWRGSWREKLGLKKAALATPCLQHHKATSFTSSSHLVHVVHVKQIKPNDVYKI